MCGITGFIAPSLFSSLSCDQLRNIAYEMVGSIRHRGPDDCGMWMDENAGIALSHARLSILDLSLEGHQPMFSTGRRYVITYNGEIYNFKALRCELEYKGEKFRGHSDTEVILAAIETWGLMAAIKRFIGMFAFALWDRHERKLFLVRDRLGIKPLYYGWVNSAFVFGSELKALKVFPGFEQSVNRSALALLMRHNCVPAPYSIYQDIYKLMPGCILTLAEGELHKNPQIKSYWSAKDMAESGDIHSFSGSDEQAVNQLDTLLQDAVKLRMVSDVPFGAFLSGGYDSSLVVALMQDQSIQPVKTFSIGSHAAKYNEACHAKLVASHLGTDHTELYVSPEEAMAVIPLLPTLYDEPFSDSSQIPTFLVSQLARQSVTVSLSGDGGDELFSGYNRYIWGQNIWNKIGGMPSSLRSTAALLIKSLSPGTWDRFSVRLLHMLPEKYKISLPGDQLHKLAGILDVQSQDELYSRLVSHWQNPCELVLGAEEPLTALADLSRKANLSNFTQQMMYLDLISYLPDDILTKVDRASMAVSLEVRVPLLDHRVVEFAWSLPQHLKLRNGGSKWILRQVLNKYVPKELTERPKMGFGIPIDQWLRGPLRDWVENLIGERRLREEGYFNHQLIRHTWKEHLAGKCPWQYHLWDVLMFQAWLEEQNKNG